MGLPRGERIRRHQWYGRLLGVCLLVLVCFALPSQWRSLSSFSYGLLPVMLVLGLGRAHHDVAFLGPGWVFRLLGLATTASSVVWAITPLAMRITGVPLLVLWALFISMSLVRLLRMLARETQVGGNVLMGAAAGYLLLGLTAGLLFAALETVQPGSFTYARGGAGSVLLPRGNLNMPDPLSAVWSLDFVRLNYFAFITLTSTGFGDITPHTPQAQMGTIVVAILGNFYIAVVMGILISRLTVQESAEAGPPETPQADAGRRDLR